MYIEFSKSIHFARSLDRCLADSKLASGPPPAASPYTLRLLPPAKSRSDRRSPSRSMHPRGGAAAHCTRPSHPLVGGADGEGTDAYVTSEKAGLTAWLIAP